MKIRDLTLVAIILICIAAMSTGQSRLFADQNDSTPTGQSQGTIAPDAPQSPAAIEARRKYDSAVKAAADEDHKALLSADQQYVSDLTALLKDTMNAGPSALDEAKRIDAARTAAVDAMEEHKSADQSQASSLPPVVSEGTPESNPRIAAAIEPRRKYDLAMKLAWEANHKAVLAADKQYISELMALLKTTMEAGPSALDEAKRIDAARTAAISMMEQHKQEGIPRTLNLIPLIDVKKDALSGTWRVDRGAIASDNTRDARLRIPYEPPDEYDYHIEFMRISGNNDVNQMFRYSDHSCSLQIGGWDNTICGFTLIEGMTAHDKNNPSRFEGHELLQNGRTYNALIQVRKGLVTASIDGKVLSKCTLDPSKFSAQDVLSVGADGLGLGTWSSPAVFSVIEVTEISGPGKLLKHGS